MFTAPVEIIPHCHYVVNKSLWEWKHKNRWWQTPHRLMICAVTVWSLLTEVIRGRNITASIGWITRIFNRVACPLIRRSPVWCPALPVYMVKCPWTIYTEPSAAPHVSLVCECAYEWLHKTELYVGTRAVWTLCKAWKSPSWQGMVNY